MTPCSLFFSALTPFLVQHPGCQNTSGTTDAGGTNPTQTGVVYDYFTLKQKVQVAKQDAKHGVTASVRYGLHRVAL